MKARLFGNSTASRFGFMVIVAALLMLAVPVTVVFAQAEGGGDDVQYNAICQNIIGAIGDIDQNQEGNANAGAANGESTSSQEASAVAEVAQEQNVSIEQVNECLNGAAGEPPNGTTGDTTAGTTGDTTGGTTGDTTGGTTGDTTAGTPSDVIPGTIPEQEVLANTGGPVLLLLPALGLLLICSVAIRNLLRR